MIAYETHIKQHHTLNVHYIHISADKVKTMGGNPSLRVWCTVQLHNKQIRFQAGFVAAGKGNAYITINAARLKELGAVYGDAVQVSLTLDKSTYGVPFPEELAVVFEQIPDAKDCFDKLSDGKKRFAIAFVNGVKNPMLRADKAVIVANNLISCNNPKMSYNDLVKKQ